MTVPLPEYPVFSLTDELPSGTTVLEASAGTGKTYTIASLATRFLAEGRVRLDDMMLVTFGRLASQELRDRVRTRLVAVEQSLAHPEAAADSADEVVRLLAAAPADEVIRRRERLATALAAFDEATIATTHSFCQRMLGGLGIAADAQAPFDFLEYTADLVRQVADDIYLSRYSAAIAPFPVGVARELAMVATGVRHARLEPADADREDLRERVSYADAVRAEFDRRKRDVGLLDFDDLQDRLLAALADSPAAGELLRYTYRVVLVDEFQDTDPVQWEILRQAFHGHPEHTLVLIGDPKQAIYAFRGADVFTYLAAAKQSHRMATLNTNWRSDAALIGALDHLWGPARRPGVRLTLGDPRIPVRPIEAHHQGQRLSDPKHTAPLWIRRLPRGVAQGNGGLIPVRDARRAIGEDLAAQVVNLLDGDATIDEEGKQRAVRPDDIAVLVDTNANGELIRSALAAVGVPVLLSARASVFASAAARYWLTLLEALDTPNRPGKVRLAALTPFVGWSATQLATATDDDMDLLIDTLRSWSRRLAASGMAALLETVTVTEGIAARVLSGRDGDRLLTDIRHVAHVLHAASREEHLGTAALLQWLRRRIDESGRDAGVELSRRLSRQDRAVQVITVHSSKGLEYPVVFVPFAWDQWVNDKAERLLLHDPDGRPVLDIGGPGGRDYAQQLARQLSEELGETLRLAYVALTRARSLLVTWWAPTFNTRCAPLHRMVFGDPEPDGSLPESVVVPDEDNAVARLTGLAAESGGLITVESVTPAPQIRYQPTAPDAPELLVRRFGRELDTGWRRTSYSSLVRAAHDAHYGVGHTESDEPHGDPVRVVAAGEVDPSTGTEPEDAGTVDEVDVPSPWLTSTVTDADREQLLAVPSPLEDFPGGTLFGTVVHDVLEYVDTAAPDLDAQLLEHCRRVVGDGGEIDPGLLAAALRPVLDTPLGPLGNGIPLAGIDPRDRLAEMAFELPLAGGDSPTTESTLADLADVLERHLPPGDLLAGYPELLRDKLISDETLRGYLTGSLDAVLRVTVEGQPRFLVVDYKTNRLGTAGKPLSAWDYRPSAMADGMNGAHYPLQALLYLVALHRYLGWRQPGYDPAVHLGGALYLFVRGMSGPDTPVVDGMPCGVFSWKPPPALVIEASAVLAGRPR